VFLKTDYGGDDMLVYSLIMFAGAIVLIIVGILVYKGKTDLIHDYHQTNVTDKKAYGKAMGKALLGFSVPLIAAGVIAFFTKSVLVTVVLLAGLAVALIPIFVVQKKYNGSVF